MAQSTSPEAYINRRTANQIEAEAEKGDPDAISMMAQIKAGIIVVHTFGKIS